MKDLVDSKPIAHSVQLKSSQLSFGRRGWIIIVLQALMFWLAAGAITHGLNVVLPALSQTYSLDYNKLLLLATPASWASIPAAPLSAWLCEKKGIKFTVILCLILCALCFGFLGYGSSLIGFSLLFAGVCFFGTGFAYVGGTALVANWFVRKQGLALGFCTIGQTFSSAFFVPVLVALFAFYGVQHGFWGMSLLMFMLAVLVWLLVANRPEDVGLLPDNEKSTTPPTANDIKQSDNAYQLSIKQLLCMRDIWFMGLSTGAIYIMLVGIVSQIIPRLIEKGYDLNTAIFYMSASALFGTLGAYGWGWLNHKAGIKPALLTYTIWWIIAITLNLFSSQATLLASMVMIGLALPGATNLSTAFIATKFPRQAYVRAIGIVHPIQSIIRCCAFSILAFGLAYLGGYVGAYLLLIAVGVVSFILIWLTNITPITSGSYTAKTP